jgi:hypothetical protein
MGKIGPASSIGVGDAFLLVRTSMSGFSVVLTPPTSPSGRQDLNLRPLDPQTRLTVHTLPV